MKHQSLSEPHIQENEIEETLIENSDIGHHHEEEGASEIIVH